MQSKAKANSIVTHALDAEGNLVFTVVGHEPVTLHLSLIHQDNRVRAELHGWIQRVTDMAAVGVTDSEGNVVPKAERTAKKAERIAAVIAHLESGSDQWNLRASALSGRSSMDAGIVVEAVAKALGKTYAEVQEQISANAKTLNLSRQVVIDVLADEYSAQIAELRAERTKDVDRAGLLGGLLKQAQDDEQQS